MKKGLMVFVLRSPTDCSNEGITTKYEKFILIGDGLPELFEPSEDTPALYLIRRNIDGQEYLNASTTPGNSGMNGGNYVQTSDSRFPIAYPIAVHDRFESRGGLK